MTKQLVRVNSNRKILGVAEGVANYVNVDPTVVRIAFVGAGVFFPLTTLATYGILGILMPKERYPTAKIHSFDPSEEIIINP